MDSKEKGSDISYNVIDNVCVSHTVTALPLYDANLVYIIHIQQVIDPNKINMFVLDEADVMIDQQGQQDQTIRIQK